MILTATDAAAMGVLLANSPFKTRACNGCGSLVLEDSTEGFVDDFDARLLTVEDVAACPVGGLYAAVYGWRDHGRVYAFPTFDTANPGRVYVRFHACSIPLPKSHVTSYQLFRLARLDERGKPVRGRVPGQRRGNSTTVPVAPEPTQLTLFA